MTLRIILAFCISFVCAYAFGKIYIPWLVRQKFGQEIKDIGPYWHENKRGNPTMGAVIILRGIIIACIPAGFESLLN